MKIIIGIIIVIICTYIGFILSEKHKVKKDFYNSFNSFNTKLISEVSFFNNSITSILSQYNNDLFIDCAKKHIFEKKEIENKYLNKEDLDFFYDYIDNIGKNDSISQKKFLESIKDEIQNRKNKSENNYKKIKNYI